MEQSMKIFKFYSRNGVLGSQGNNNRPPKNICGEKKRREGSWRSGSDLFDKRQEDFLITYFLKTDKQTSIQ